MRTQIRYWFILLTIALAAASVHSQDFPNRPVKIIVPQTPGGASDALARIVGQKLSEKWMQPVFIENRPGAGGNIGMEVVANAPADGHTLLMSYVGTHAINGSLYKNLPFDPEKDFAPVATLATLTCLRIEYAPLFLQRCVHESLRLHPASPVAQRRAVCPVALSDGFRAATDDRVVIDMSAANRDPGIFGLDAERFNPHRILPEGVPSWGLTFGVGAHTCLGRDLDGGVLPRADTDSAAHPYGIVPLLVRALLQRKARPDSERPAMAAEHTVRANWGSYPILLDTPAWA